MIYNPPHFDTVLLHCGGETNKAKKLKLGTIYEMDNGNMMTTQIINANTKNCDCSKCDRWNTRALPTLVNSMEKKGKDTDYMQRTLDNVLKKNYACEKQVEETKPVKLKNKYRVGGVQNWRQHGHGKRATTIPKAKYIVPFVAPGNERAMEAEPQKVEKKVAMDQQKEQTDWVEVPPPRRRQLRTESRNRARHMHKYGGDEKISVRKVEIDKKKKNKIEKPMTLKSFFKKKASNEEILLFNGKISMKKKKKSNPSTNKWEKPQMTGKPASPSYTRNFPELQSDDEDEEDEKDEKVKKVKAQVPTFYDRTIIKYVLKRGFDAKAGKNEPIIINEDQVCPFWRGKKGRDGCNHGSKCNKGKHSKPTCESFIKFGYCNNQYCEDLHSFTETHIHGREASNAPAIRRKMWMDRKKKRKSGVRKPPGPGYVCHCCNKPGHWKQDCPTSRRRAFYR